MASAVDSITLPKATGYRMPAEWEKHEATWIAWPHNITDWPGKFHPIPWVFAEVVKHVSEDEELRILVRDDKMERIASRIIEKADAARGKISFYQVNTNRSWLRDSLPTFVVNRVERKIGAIKWHFNAWAKYSDWQADEKAGEFVAKLSADCCWYPKDPSLGKRIVLEGGAIDVDGEGLLLTTEECLLSEIQARNPGYKRADYELVFSEYLGATEVVWLAGGIAGDDTHGHVDDVARFVGPRKVVTLIETDPVQPHFETLRENLKRLRNYRDKAGRALEVIEVPLPRPVIFDGQRLPASYVNFYITNNKVLVPTFNDPNDRVALNTLQSAFPDRSVVGIHCLDLVLGLGTLHCMTQQQPCRD